MFDVSAMWWLPSEKLAAQNRLGCRGSLVSGCTDHLAIKNPHLRP